MKKRQIDVDMPGERLDRFLARRLPEFTRGFCKDLIERGRVTVGGAVKRPDNKVKDGDHKVQDHERDAWPGLDFDSWVIHEDSSLIVLNKPSGLLMHPLGETWLKEPEAASREPDPNLAGLLLRVRPEIAKAGTPRCGLVHRLDRPTSGVLLVAKTPAAHAKLVEGFAEREIAKTYRAIVLGAPEQKRIDVNAPVGRQPGRRRMEVLPWGRPSQTEFKIVETATGASLVEARPKTGRTHQIRVHLAEVGLPVLGDPESIRGPERAKLSEYRLPDPPRLMLHAYQLRFVHPKTKKPAQFTAPLPKDFKAYWMLLRNL
ncbi:MAG: RluA family pseudouridine synthase [Elusimicrobia bacterium]|nr:RluA family pseudouridine synthase [Elusimicrobiota bacterium]